MNFLVNNQNYNLEIYDQLDIDTKQIITYDIHPSSPGIKETLHYLIIKIPI